MPLREGAIRWDIVEEHLDEAGFLFGQWEGALRSPKYTVSEIADGPEARMLAHLDGLAVVGPRAAPEWLIPGLAAEAPGVAFAAAFALLEGGRPADLEAVLAALEKSEPPVRADLRRALAVVPRPDIGARLLALVPKGSGIQVDLLEVLTQLRLDPAFPLEPLVNTHDPAKEAVCLRVARVFPSRLNPLGVQRALASPVAEVRAAALQAGLVVGDRAALAACEATVREGGPGFREAAIGLALAGEERSVPPLVAALGDERLATEAAFALGFTGRIAAADALVKAMEVEDLARVAAEGLSAIGGLMVAKQFLQEPPAWAPGLEDEGDDTAGSEADLPMPDPETVARWWKEARPRFDSAQRWFGGQRWSPEALVRELESGLARRRETLAFELAIRTKGQLHLSWDALSARQRKELQQIRSGLARIAGR
jgi:uncharacterized protein (TIGR02270 family)